MSEKDKGKSGSEERIIRLVDDSDVDKRFGYRPPAIKVQSDGDSEEKGYVPPSNPPAPKPTPPPPPPDKKSDK